MRLSTHKVEKGTPLATLATSISVELLTIKHTTWLIKPVLYAEVTVWVRNIFFLINIFVMLLLYIFSNEYILRMGWMYVVDNSVCIRREVAVLMIKQRDLTIKQTLTELKRHQAILDQLHETLVTRALLQEYTEEQYNALVMLAKEGMDFLSDCHRGDVIDDAWLVVRDDLLMRAQRLIQDAPDT
jgi:hypothetical protein